MLKQNPCRYCANHFEYKGKHTSGWECQSDCKYIKEHKEYLLSKRKFTEGEQIHTLDELLKQEWVMWYHSTKHIEVIKSNQLRTVLSWLEHGALHKAIRKFSEPMQAESENK